jgi:signal transduction histidine kinase
MRIVTFEEKPGDARRVEEALRQAGIDDIEVVVASADAPTLAHQLRNPLNVLTMTVDLLGEDTDESRRAGLLEKMQRAIARMAELVDQLDLPAR